MAKDAFGEYLTQSIRKCLKWSKRSNVGLFRSIPALRIAPLTDRHHRFHSQTQLQCRPLSLYRLDFSVLKTEKNQNSRTENDLLNFRISLTLGQLFYRVGHFALFQAQSKNTSPVHLYFYLCKRRGRLKVNGATKYGHCVFE